MAIREWASLTCFFTSSKLFSPLIRFKRLFSILILLGFLYKVMSAVLFLLLSTYFSSLSLILEHLRQNPLAGIYIEFSPFSH